tara:strand:- start:6011 stop:7459 length:1449 start_codon:yes stop_codon:yes gene_type:complete
MLFNSLDFAIFLPVVFVLYWFLVNRRIKLQNLLIVLASYTFYGWWDWRFLILIFFSTLVDYSIGRMLAGQEDQKRRKLYLYLSVIINLSLLGFFKYYNFFLDSFVQAFSFFGEEIKLNYLQIILPIGISFYTFQTLSYTIDVYKREMEPSKDFIAFAAFVSFFPQLVAGPIERASSLLPQFLKQRTFDYIKAVDGLRQILWGLFKKIVIADNAAKVVNEIFANSDSYNGSTLVLGAVFFAFQVYGDFSGYSDIAIGTARLFGFNLMQNFAFPYFSRDIAEHWRRWHISLNTWFRDYLYIPLGGSRGGALMKLRNTALVFIVSGFWHGANWTYIVWAFLNILYFLPFILRKKKRTRSEIVAFGKVIPSLREVLQILGTFSLNVFAYIFFRSETVGQAFSSVRTIFSESLFSLPQFEGMLHAFITFILILIFMSIEWFGRNDQFAIAKLGFTWKRHWRQLFYYSIMLAIFLFMGKQEQFVYFQF